MVDDRFAGQSGPCAGCGQTIYIPAAGAGGGTPFGAKQPARPSSGLGWILGIGAALLLGGGCVTGIVLLVVLPSMERQKRFKSANNLKQIVLALHNYHDVYKRLPPAVVRDATGKPLYSWRVAILPFLEQQNLHNQFDKSQAWDSPANIAISNMALEVFRSPGDGSCAANGTNYFVVLASGKNFNEQTFLGDGKRQNSFAAITDGTSNTIAVLELKGIAGSGAAPNDPEFDKLDLVIGNQSGQLHPVQATGLQVAMADGSISFLPSTTDAETLRRLLLCSDGQVVTIPGRGY